MLVFMRLLFFYGDYVCYEYSDGGDIMFGTVTANIRDMEDISFDFYENSPVQNFTAETARVVGYISKHINDRAFSETYIYSAG